MHRSCRRRAAHGCGRYSLTDRCRQDKTPFHVRPLLNSKPVKKRDRAQDVPKLRARIVSYFLEIALCVFFLRATLDFVLLAVDWIRAAGFLVVFDICTI
jgi:hypothetical protein